LPKLLRFLLWLFRGRVKETGVRGLAGRAAAGAGQAGETHGVKAAGLQVVMHLLGPVDNFRWDAGKLRHLDAVTLGGGAGGQPVEKDDLAGRFRHQHLEAAN